LLAAHFPQRYPVLFDSAAAGEHTRHSLLAAYPSACLWQDSTRGIHGSGDVPPDVVAAGSSGFLDRLDLWWRLASTKRSAQPIARADVGFHGGWAVFLGYEIADEIEPGLVLPASSLPVRAFALRTRAGLVHDVIDNAVHAIAEPGHESLLDEIENDVVRLAGDGASSRNADARLTDALYEEAGTAFLARVERAKRYIAAGDIYQANLSRWWRGRLLAGPVGREAAVAALYPRLRAANPAPFAALATFGDVSLLSSSPERLVRIVDREISTRPIAGTRPRSPERDRDQIDSRALAEHPKERAEHVMLIDLERNDLGRVCEPGSVGVDEFMAIETYAHVHHIVSNVRGRLRSEVTPVQALRAVFPGGTITGCPKIRGMQVIAELEGEGRGAYTGSLGYLTLDGHADFNILIRTITIAAGSVEVRAGAGIVADSDPERELEETRAKAQGMLLALGSQA